MPTSDGSPTPRKYSCEIRASDGFGALSVTHRQAERDLCVDASTYWHSEHRDLDSHAPALPACNWERNTASVRTPLP